MKIALGLSGGVDSAVCATLLQQHDHDVTCVFLECWRSPGCRAEEDRADALKIALSLDLPFEVLDFKTAYKEKVVEHFFSEYEAGRTPNPDVLCNKEIKFGLFYDWAMNSGFDAVATGHYAKTNEKGELLIPKDTAKDQTYFLYLLTSNQLKHTVFPLADMEKSEVRTFAQESGLSVATKPDSVGICFIGDIDVHAFLKERLGEKPGEVVDTKGRVIGTHTGLWFYTIGQRHGFTIDKKTVNSEDQGKTIDKECFPPLYVIRKDSSKNQLVVGFGADTHQQTFTIDKIHWIAGSPPENGTKLFVRIRHTGKLLGCSIEDENDKIIVRLDTPTQGIAEGQAAVLYWRKSSEIHCVGGGTIHATVSE